MEANNKAQVRRMILLDPRCGSCRRDLGGKGYAIGGWGVCEEVWCAECLVPLVTEAKDHSGRTSRVEHVEVADKEILDLPARERDRDAVLAMEREGWRVWGIDSRGTWGWGTDVTAAAEVDGHEVLYALTLGDRDQWKHHFGGLGLEFGVYLDAPAPRVASPETALRLLRETDERHRSFLRSATYGYLLALCGPGEEPDPGEVERLCEESHRTGALPSELDQDIVEYDPYRDRSTEEDVAYAVKRPTGTGG